jgi:adenine-specific DNA-methyltransferase
MLDLPERGLKKTLGDEYEEKLVEFVSNNAQRVIRLARPDYSAVSSEARMMIDASRNKTDEVMRLNRSGFSDMYGYIDDLLIYKDVARYTADFEPPTQAFPDSAC